MMDEPILSEFPRDFTETLFDFCDAPAPDPRFTAQLEQRLLEHQATVGSAPQPVATRLGNGGRSSSVPFTVIAGSMRPLPCWWRWSWPCLPLVRSASSPRCSAG